VKTTTRQRNLIQFGDENLDLSGLEQLVEKSQTRAIAEALGLLRTWIGQSQTSGSLLAQLLKRLDTELEAKVHTPRLHMPRRTSYMNSFSRCNASACMLCNKH